MMEDNEHVRLMTKYLSRSASPDEEAALQQWLDADPDHPIELEAMKKLWESSGNLFNQRRFDEKAAWKKIDPRQQASPDTYTSPVIFRRRWTKTLAAASVLLVMGAGWWYYNASRNGPQQHVLAAGDVRQLTLPDGSMVWLRKGAELLYPNRFGSRARQVELSGEAFFAPAPDATRPFRIHTTHVTIEDIGTSFLVKDRDTGGEVVVATGKVKLTANEDLSHPLVLSPGQKATISKNKLSFSGMGTPNFISWKTGLLEFRQAPLDQVARDISDHFKASVSIAPDLRNEAGEIKVTARFDHQPLEQVLEEVRLTTGLQTKQEKDTLFFARK
ncbi:FecR domain-containing protein [Flavitalea sp. BT771]|uniref:FecR domain-containing protein n=1 Tax=Flavitalea sp. BT771 TaxID=3063329 RepID=UPI0026E46362|nr:FecR domain-containing protein [Flavitalea sp. BT771]MDO6433436.1 FecR domain-containing protein [Flavitalea sp. BT771]MDV6222659.1 FecR domain-containing protein [Flavitalea sp. BT771]